MVVLPGRKKKAVITRLPYNRRGGSKTGFHCTDDEAYEEISVHIFCKSWSTKTNAAKQAMGLYE